MLSAPRLPMVLLLLLFLWLPALAQDEAKKHDVPAGHSLYGEVFNEGPRQRAYLMGGTGKVHFPVSTKDRLAQQFFDQGVGQLHGFWFFEAERSFRQVAALDPDCALAYWGMAKANLGNAARAKGFIKKASERKQGLTRREQLYLDGLAEYIDSSKDKKQRQQQYVRSLENIIHEFPDDIEAKAALVVCLWQFRADLPIVSHQAVDALLDQVFAVNPMHPAHHYRIHLWDGVKPQRALSSAARCGQSAPAIAHQWHMSGHTYSGLQRYADAAWEQEASARADHAYMIHDRVMPDQIHNYAHNQEWLIRNLSHIGRVRDAVALARNLIELPRHPRYNTLARQVSSAGHGRKRLFEVLERYEMSEELISLGNSMYLEPTDVPEEQVRHLRALGVAQGNKQDLANLRKQIAALEVMARQQQAAPGEPKEKQAKGPANQLQLVENAVNELKAYEAQLTNDARTALELAIKVKDLNKARMAWFYLQAGDKPKAEELARQAADAAPNQVVPLANYVAVLHACGKGPEAADAFGKLRQRSGHLDSLDVPVFKRLEPIARALDLPADWRLPPPAAKDLGERPPLASIGPLRWHPAPAPEWTLPDAVGKSVALKEYRGRPVVVIFYLGYGCLHCIEQLNRFAPKTKDFAAAGISLVAVSTDPLDDLKKSQQKYKEGGSFPFPLVSDEKLEIFKRYRAHDDFENKPLHGTFLIDAQGLVRWQDISYEPFGDADFLLKEARRLLALPIDR